MVEINRRTFLTGSLVGIGAGSLIYGGSELYSSMPPKSGSLGTSSDSVNVGSGNIQPATVDNLSVDTNGKLPTNYIADQNAMPEGWRDSANRDWMNGISLGGGVGNPTIDWSVMPISTLRVPEIQLSIPIVEKTAIPRNDGTGDTDVEVPVSFQCGWNNKTAPLSGSSGVSVLSGHYNWANGDLAPMSNLYWSKVGMSVFTSDFNGNLIEWVITKVGNPINQSLLTQEYNTRDLNGEKRLLMLTCNYDNSTGGFTNNLPVEARPKN